MGRRIFWYLVLAFGVRAQTGFIAFDGGVVKRERPEAVVAITQEHIQTRCQILTYGQVCFAVSVEVRSCNHFRSILRWCIIAG